MWRAGHFGSMMLQFSERDAVWSFWNQWNPLLPLWVFWSLQVLQRWLSTQAFFPGLCEPSHQRGRLVRHLTLLPYQMACLNFRLIISLEKDYGRQRVAIHKMGKLSEMYYSFKFTSSNIYWIPHSLKYASSFYSNIHCKPTYGWWYKTRTGESVCVCVCVCVCTSACGLGSSLRRQPTWVFLVWMTPAPTKFAGLGSTPVSRATPKPKICRVSYRREDDKINMKYHTHQPVKKGFTSLSVSYSSYDMIIPCGQKKLELCLVMLTITLDHQHQ